MWWSPKSESFQPPKEWKAIGTGIGHVDPDHADGNLALERPGDLAGRREHRGSVAVRVGVHQVDGVVQRWYADDAEHGSEDLLGVNRHVRADVVDQCRTDEEAVFEALDSEVAAVEHQSGSIGLTLADEALDLVAAKPH